MSVLTPLESSDGALNPPKWWGFLSNGVDHISYFIIIAEVKIYLAGFQCTIMLWELVIVIQEIS
jgi:hypothetical protein